MDLILIHALWGIDEAPATALPRIKDGGYGGVETSILFPDAAYRRGLRQALDRTGLRMIPQCFTCAGTTNRSVEDHLASFRTQLADAQRWDPLLINVHSGSDAWSTADMVRFYRECVRIERDLRVPVAHETHRGRCLFSPWTTRVVLEEVPELRFTADLSHWVCVAERIIDDQLPIIRQLAGRTRHIHARVGYSQGPQVPDPRDAAHAAELAAHERWWDLCWDGMAAQGMGNATLTPESGPIPYMHQLAFTHQPVADFRAINRWMGERQRERFQGRASVTPAPAARIRGAASVPARAR